MPTMKFDAEGHEELLFVPSTLTLCASAIYSRGEARDKIAFTGGIQAK